MEQGAVVEAKEAGSDLDPDGAFYNDVLLSRPYDLRVRRSRLLVRRTLCKILQAANIPRIIIRT